MISVHKKTSRARQLRKNFTDAEQILWRTVRSRQLGGHKFRRQQPVGRYIVDFVCLEASLVIEVDGGQHAEIRQAAYDEERTAWVRQQGFRVLRFWDHEVLKQLDGVKEAIIKSLAANDSAS
jgi:very-short-patch-repair endonuclease